MIVRIEVALLVVASASLLPFCDVAVTEAAAPITAASFVPAGDAVAIGSQDGIEIRSWPGLEWLRKLDSNLSHVHDLKFSPDGSVLLAAGGSPGEEGVVESFAWPAAERTGSAALHEDVVYRISWSPDGERFATASADGTCKICDGASGEPLIEYEGHSRAVLSIAFLPDGETVVSVGVDETMRLWNAVDGSHLRTLAQHTGVVNDVVLRPDRSGSSTPIVATVGDDRTVRFWQPTIGRMTRFARLPAAARTAVWSPNGDRLFAGCDDGSVRSIDPETAQILPALVDPPEDSSSRVYVLTADAEGRLLYAGETPARALEAPPDENRR